MQRQNGETAAPTNRRRNIRRQNSPLLQDTPAAGAMCATALLSVFSLCVQMTTVCAGDAEPKACTNPHEVMSAVATGSELTAAGSSCDPKGKGTSAPSEDPAVSGSFLVAAGLISLPGRDRHFHGTSGSVAHPSPRTAAGDSLEQHELPVCGLSRSNRGLEWSSGGLKRGNITGQHPAAENILPSKEVDIRCVAAAYPAIPRCLCRPSFAH
eukprot:SAG22_NODE_25_length_30107_cov_28.456412_19_plen_211_part_00